MFNRIHTIIMSILSIAICAIFAVEVFAATNLSLSINGSVRYTAKDIGAEIAATCKVNTTGGTGAENYAIMSPVEGLGTVDSYGVFTIAGTGTDYSANVIGDANITFDVVTDTIDIYLFVRNRGARSFMPSVSIVPETGLLADVYYYYLPTSSATQPISLIRSGTTASALNTTMDGLTLDTDYFDFTSKNSLINSEVLFAKITLSVDPSHAVNLMGETFDYLLNIELIMDVQYWEGNNILTVCHENDVVDSAWTKVGYNNTLSATPIKANVTATSQLNNAYVAGINNNADLTAIDANLTYQCDDYDNVVIYKDIDIVNVDIATGEIIGKLSDLNYPFEWYGGDVTLPAGTILASGRELSTAETFTVDVYTYYPTVYIRRVVVNNGTYISITDQPYTNLGFVKVDAHYVATCEAFTYNPDKTLAYNSYGIIARSYVNGGIPLEKGANNKMETSMGYTNGTALNSQVDTTPANMLSFTTHLTQQWQDYATNNPSMAIYTQQSVTGVAAQDWHQFVYKILYIVKYANYSSQTVIGKGNTLSANSKFFERVGGTIGYMVNSKLTYGYSNSTPYFSTDFLTYNNGTKRILRDGYVGTDGYTSVSCLGMLNPWGNVYQWVFGVTIIPSTSKVAPVYVQFSEYDGTNYCLSRGDNTTTVAEKETILLNMGYLKLSYNIPYYDGYYRYNGTHHASHNSSYTTLQNQMLSLVNVPTADAQRGSNSTGMCDYHRTRSGTDNLFYTLASGGSCGESDSGLFVTSSRNYADHLWENIGFRTRLQSASA